MSRELVDVCSGCKTVKPHKGSRNWQGGDWGDPCKFCGAPIITCRRDQIDDAYNSAQRP